MKLSEKNCIATKKGEQPYSKNEAVNMLKQIHSNWKLETDSTMLTRAFKFKNFSAPMNLAIKIGEMAEAENHHPDLHISWGCLGVTITTHLIKGLVESDFIFAAKVDDIFESFST